MPITSTGLSTKGLRAEFNSIFSERDKLTYWRDLCTIINSDSDKETYRFMGSVPQMREFGAERQGKGVNVESYDVENRKYEITLEVDRDEISDDQTGQINLRIQDMAKRAASHKDSLLGTLILNGASTGFNGYDGVSFFNDAHISGLSGAQDNDATFDISARQPSEPNTPTDPSPNTIRSAVADVLGLMAMFQDDYGEFKRTGQTQIIVCCRPEVYFIFNQALNAGLLSSLSTSGGSTNTSILPGTAGGVPKVIPVPEITSVDFFYVFDVGGGVKPFILQDREPIEFNSLEADSDEGFRREKYLYGIRARYRLTYGDPLMGFRMQLI